MGPETTIVGSSLPPMVEGQLRCFLSIKLCNIKWSVPRPPRDIQVKVSWWGQSGNSAVLRPEVDTDPNYLAAKNKHSEVHYPIRCGPRQFQAYLNDMNGLHFDVVFGPSCTSFATVNISDIVSVSPTSILDRHYTLLCTTTAYQGREVGQLKAVISFKSISDTYNISSSIIPTTDKEFRSPLLANKKDKKGNLKEKVDVKSKLKNEFESAEKVISRYERHNEDKIEDEFDKENQFKDKKILHTPVPIKSKKPKQKSTAKIHEKVTIDEDYSFVVGHGATGFNQRKDKVHHGKISSKDDSNSDSEFAEPFVTRTALADAPMKRFDKNHIQKAPVVLKGIQRATVLSSLLSKTHNLRNSIIKHALESDDGTKKQIGNKSSSKGSSGTLLKELIGENDSGSLEDLDDISLDGSLEKCSAAQEIDRLDTKVVDLILGKEEKIGHLMRKVDMSMDSSASCFSDDQDPLHDSSLLDDLLYTTKALQKIDESSIVSFNETKLIEAKKNLELDKQTIAQGLDNSCDLIPTKEIENSVEENVSFEDSLKLLSRNVPGNVGVAVKDSESSESISVETLTRLGRVKSAKLLLREFSLSSKKYGVVYFVEFKFPVLSEEKGRLSMENVTHVSRHVDQVVDFGRFSLFPILFNEQMVEYWWQNYVCFKFYSKFDCQEKAEWLGEGYMKLRDVLLNSEFRINNSIDIYSDNKKYTPIGQLKLHVELAAEHGKSVQIMTKTASLPPVPSTSVKIGKKEVAEIQLTPIKINSKFQKHRKETKRKSCESLKSTNPPPTEYVDKKETSNVFLHNLIVVTNGKKIIYSTENTDQTLCNTYFVCRIFWNSGELKSRICWSTVNPDYRFQQIIPVTLSVDTLKKMEKNLMIIEVWHKSTTTDKDKLIGMSKVSLQQFFISYKDPKLAETMMQSKYPVIAHDGSVPVVNLFSGKEHGSLEVLFALGTHDQVEALIIERSYLPEPSRGECMDRITSSYQGSVGHYIDVYIGGVKSALQDGNEVYGEADCYIQYHFPQQQVENELKMDSFKTKTTLCLPNPVFNHSTTHSYTMERNEPLQRLLLECFKSKFDTISFELWKRHYYPNPRDQLIAKASLPLAKLCAIISMPDSNDPSQSFELPMEDVRGVHSGTLDVLIRYRQRVSDQRSSRLPKQVVCLSLSINRVCGLKDGLELLSKKQKNLSRAYKNGPNMYIKLSISFLGKTSTRSTNTVAQSFSPTFNYHIDFPLPLTFGLEDDISLAEMLHDGFVVCQVMHEFVELQEDDVVLGVVNIPLKDLLLHDTGVKGWWELRLPDNHTEKEPLAGGIEVSAKFTKNTDRNQVLDIGCRMGWAPSTNVELHDETSLHPMLDDEDSHSVVNIHCDLVLIPKNVIEQTISKYQDAKDRFGTMYCRYKFYNKAPIYSKSAKIKLDRDVLLCSLRHSSCHEVIPNTSFAWYLREEKIEIQFWLSWSNYTAKNTSFTRQQDRLVGSSFVDISSFSQSPKLKTIISGQYPLFLENCDRICNSYSRISVAYNTSLAKDPKFVSVQRYENSNDESISINEDESFLENAKKATINEQSNDDDPDDGTGELLKVDVEEAMHLPNVSNIYVSYQLPKLPLKFTGVSKTKVKHRWQFQKQHKIKLDSLKGRRIIFQVLKCTGERQKIEEDILVGTAELDAGPLFYGMNQILGWYNIHDLSRQIVGQIKLGLTPSTVPGPPVSHKYFQSKPPIPPVNLPSNNYSNPLPTFILKPDCHEIDSNSDNTTIFQKLHSHLHDLQNLTSRIQERAFQTTKVEQYQSSASEVDASKIPAYPYDPVPEIVPEVVPEVVSEIIPNLPEVDDVKTSLSYNTINVDGIEDDAEKASNDEPLISFQNNEEQSGICNDDVASVETDHIPEKLCEEELLIESRKDSVEKQDIFEIEDLLGNEDREDDDELDNTDALLSDLKKFRQKFTVIKNSIEKEGAFEQDSWISDSEIIHINPHKKEEPNDTFDAKGGELQTEKSCLHFSPIEIESMPKVTNASSADICKREFPGSTFELDCFYNVEEDLKKVHEVNREIYFQEGDISKDLILNVAPLEERVSFSYQKKQNSDNILDSDKNISSDTPSITEPIASGSPVASRNLFATDESRTSEDFLRGLDYSSDEDETTKSTQKRQLESGMQVNLPNFFMRPEELAESMQALRMAAKFRQSPRRSVSSSIDASSASFRKTKPETSGTQTLNKELKEKIKRQSLPVEASEMARIANIFSLKNQSK